jgi:hypothetical protein
MRCISHHRCKYPLLPMRQCGATKTVQNALLADVIGDVVEPNAQLVVSNIWL